MSEQEREQILSRIEKLERQNRTLKSGAILVLIAVASVGLMGQTTTHKKRTTKPAEAAPAAAAPALPKDIEAESFTLKDPNGKVRAELAMSGTGPALKLRDASGSALVTISLNDAAPGGPFVLLSDPQHKAGVTLSVLENAGSQFLLTGDRPDIQAHIGVAQDGTSMQLSDAEGFSTNIGNNVQTGKNGQAKKTTAASITLYNKDHKVLWSTP
ncbi:MAG TPA: hypothetical protein VG322_06325 [Candidatus Acidoferrales bacterium]|jgi:hypothetical protein|nr:hypothetical protein [Candidatus Acidoferrales bacterium]